MAPIYRSMPGCKLHANAELSGSRSGSSPLNATTGRSYGVQGPLSPRITTAYCIAMNDAMGHNPTSYAIFLLTGG